MRYDIVSDTHGFLSRELLRELEGADVIVHAGDMCSTSDYQTLAGMAELKMCLGNNDYADQYGPFVRKDCRFYADRLRWQVCHYRERLDLEVCEIAICGHTQALHRDGPAHGDLDHEPRQPHLSQGPGPQHGQDHRGGRSDRLGRDRDARGLARRLRPGVPAWVPAVWHEEGCDHLGVKAQPGEGDAEARHHVGGIVDPQVDAAETHGHHHQHEA